MAAPQSSIEFQKLLERSGLLPSEALTPFFRDAQGNIITDYHHISERLVEERLLTPFHVHQLSRGRSDGFFLTEKYKVLDFIGSGGMGKVYLCEHLLLNRIVAIKLLQISEGDKQSTLGTIERFYREARAVAALDHPNIVRVFDVDRVDGNPFMVMEYVDGSNLNLIVNENGPLPANRVAHYIAQSAAGLEHADRCGLVHRDIKPGNILLDRSGIVKILDLGLARFSRDLTKNHSITAKFDSNSVLGTVDYMAPEQASGRSEVDIRADIYSLGCTMYFLLTGSVPFPNGSIPMKMYWHQTRAPEPLSILCPRMPRGISDVLDRMMAKDPDDRYQKPEEIVAALAEWTSEPIAPPAAHEMPVQPVSIYRLGLSPPPSSSSMMAATPQPWGASETVPEPRSPALVSPTPTRPVRPFTGQFSEDPSVVFASKKPPSSRKLAPKSKISKPPSSKPPRKLPSSEIISADRSVSVRFMIWLLVGIVVLVATGGFFIWQSLQNGSKTTTLTNSGPQNINPTTRTQTGKDVKTEPMAAGTIVGGGSTFVIPIMDPWRDAYETEKKVKIKYSGVGSGKGIEGMIEGKFVFGCTDAYMTDTELQKAEIKGGTVLHIPLVMGAVVPAYNLPGVKQPLKFTGQTLADIYLGKITHWNDDSIKSSNKGVTLPELPIKVVHRSGSSGTTFIWTDYLSKKSPEWKKEFGAKKEVKWLVGESKASNNAVAEYVVQTEGALGYVELSYALENNLPHGDVKNQAGRFVRASVKSVKAAAEATIEEKDFPFDLRYTLTDAPGDESYPITGTTWAILYADQTQNPNGAELVDFLRWATHEGQRYVNEVKYVELPPELVKRIDAKLATVKLPKK